MRVSSRFLENLELPLFISNQDLLQFSNYLVFKNPPVFQYLGIGIVLRFIVFGKVSVTLSEEPSILGRTETVDCNIPKV